MAGESFSDLTLTPITDAATVRSMTGYLTEKDCPTAEVTASILRAQYMTLAAIADRVSNIPLWGAIDGTNLRYSIPPRFAHRVILDANTSGAESNDVAVTLEGITSGSHVPPTYTAATVASVDPLQGIITLSAAPAPATTRRLLFSGWLVGHALTKQDFKTAVELLACHLVDKRVRGPGAVVLSNPQAGNKEGTSPNRTWEEDWERLVALMRRGRPRAASVRTGFPFPRLGRVECDDYPPEGCWR